MKRQSITNLLAILLVLAAAPLHADNIYKYEDENGIWHFTDKLPKDQENFEAVWMEREPEPRITLRQEGDQRNPVYMLHNRYWGPAEVEVTLSTANNVMTEPPVPVRLVLGAQAEEPVLGIGALDPRKPFSYKLHYSWAPGPPNPLPVTGIVVHPPFPAGQSFPISQGFNGTETHDGPDSQFAVDIVMPVGTPVLAARDGTVMDVEEDFSSGGTDKQTYVEKANRVLILHDDGTMAVYAHIDLASVHVRPGLHVRAGRQIARSGNTGFSTGPHLHFAIQQNIGMEVVSLPFKFVRPGAEPAEPLTNQLLKGTMPLR